MRALSVEPGGILGRKAQCIILNLCGLEGQGEYQHRPDWEYQWTDTWYFDKDYRCLYQEEERGARAQDQFDSVIGSQVIESSFSVREHDSDDDILILLSQRLREEGGASAKKARKAKKLVAVKIANGDSE